MDAFQEELDAVKAQRDDLKREREDSKRERDDLKRERDHLQAKLNHFNVTFAINEPSPATSKHTRLQSSRSGQQAHPVGSNTNASLQVGVDAGRGPPFEPFRIKRFPALGSPVPDLPVKASVTTMRQVFTSLTVA